MTLPFLPAYFRSLGMAGWQIGALLAVSPVFSLLSPPVFGHLADRTGRGDRLLRIAVVGALLGLVPLAVAERFPALLGSMLCYALFAATIVPMVDSLTLARITSVGGNYAHVRLFGSVGFVVSSVAFGFAVAEVDRRAVLVPIALIAGLAVWSFGVRARAEPAHLAHPLAGLSLLRDVPFTLALVACAAHWIASAPFHGTFSIHVGALGLPPWVVGVSSGLGVVAEVGVMFAWPRLATRIRPLALLAVAFFGSAVRWTGMALATSATAIVLLSLLHGLTFGAFYVAAVAHVAAKVPQRLRASGQGVFHAITFGVGGIVGYLGAGTGYDVLGGSWLFAAGAGLDALAGVLVLWLNLSARGASDRA